MLQYAYHGTKTMFSIIIIALVQLKIDALIFPTYIFRDYYFPSLERMMCDLFSRVLDNVFYILYFQKVPERISSSVEFFLRAILPCMPLLQSEKRVWYSLICICLLLNQHFGNKQKQHLCRWKLSSWLMRQGLST